MTRLITALTAAICDQGGSISAKLTPSVTHLLISDSEWAKRGAKTRAVLTANEDASRPRIWIVDQAWLTESIEQSVRLDESEWDLELNEDESDEEYDRMQREENEVEKAAKKAEKVKAQKEKKRAQSQEDGASSDAMISEASTSRTVVDKSFEMNGACSPESLLVS